jgi:hypothetical protein
LCAIQKNKMEEEKDDTPIIPSGKIKDVIDATAGLVKAIPIYGDAVQPAAKQIGKALETVTKAVNVALAPVGLLIWGYDKIQGFIDNSVAKKLENVPEEQIQTPDPHVAGPALESLKYTGQNDALQEMFANLIANSMDSETAKNAHPAFVDIIKSMTSDEAKILKVFIPNIYKPIIDVKLKMKMGTKGEHNLLYNYSAIGQEAKCEHVDLVPNYIDNLCRLGLLTMPSGRHLVGDNSYDILIGTKEYQDFKTGHETEHTTTVEIRKYIELTKLGAQFREACVVNKK